MEQEFEDYWKKCRQLLIKNAPTALYEERKSNTKMNTAGDWFLFILPIVVMVGFYDAHVIANVIVNFLITLVLGIIVFVGTEMLKPYITNKRSLTDIDNDIKQYFYRMYKEKGLTFIEKIIK